jgi:hypothetical protein
MFEETGSENAVYVFLEGNKRNVQTFLFSVELLRSRSWHATFRRRLIK